MKKVRQTTIALLITVLCVTMSGCTDYDTNPPVITNERAMLIDVDTVTVNSNPHYDSPTLLRVAPEYLVQEWFKKKLQAVGRNSRRFEVEVTHASTVKSPNSSSPKFTAYTTELGLELRLYEPSHNLATKRANLMMRITREVDRSATIPERQAFFAGMTRELVRKMDAEIPPQIQKYFGEYLIAQ